MKKNQIHQKTITKVLFVIYLILLIWIVLMKTEFSFKDLYAIRKVNLIPFSESVIINDKIELKQIDTDKYIEKVIELLENEKLLFDEKTANK